MEFGKFPLHHIETQRPQLSTAVKEKKKNYFKVGQLVVFQINNYVITVMMSGATCGNIINGLPSD